jgi:PleD family two-component response regulator
VLAFHTGAVAQVYEWVDTLRMAIENTEISDGENEFNVTMTFGLAVVGPFDEIHDAMEEADSKLYYGKNHGRNQVVT